jgi:hypothetical protein
VSQTSRHSVGGNFVCGSTVCVSLQTTFSLTRETPLGGKMDVACGATIETAGERVCARAPLSW